MAELIQIVKDQSSFSINEYHYYLTNPSSLVYDFFEQCYKRGEFYFFIDAIMSIRSYYIFFTDMPPDNIFDYDVFEQAFDDAKLKVFVELNKNYDILHDALLTEWYDEAIRVIGKKEIIDSDSLLVIENFLKVIQTEFKMFSKSDRRRLCIPTNMLFMETDDSILHDDLIDLLIDKKYMNVMSQMYLLHVIITIIVHDVPSKRYAEKILKSINYVKITDPSIDFTFLKNKINELEEMVAQ